MDDCIEWAGTRTQGGYGRDGRSYAHRLAYERAKGPIPAGLEVDHLCRNPGCVNPKHLEAVTHRENVLRGNTFVARNAAKVGCPHGHPYDRIDRGRRICSTCQKQRNDQRRKAVAR